MDELLETIRKAVAPDADQPTKQAGANACRAILAALEAQPGEPLAVAPAPAPTSPIATVVRQFQGAPPGLVLDALIAKLRSHLPPEETGTPAQVPSLRIPFVPLPQPPRGGKP